MPLAITRYPRGLIDAFGVRSDGQMPRELADQVVLTSDATDFYLSNTFDTVGGNAATLVSGFNEAFRVPPNEMWILLHANAALGGADPGVSSNMGIALVGSAGAVIISPMVVCPAGGVGTSVLAPSRLCLPSGARVGLFLNGIAGGAYTGASQGGVGCAVYRLRAGG